MAIGQYAGAPSPSPSLRMLYDEDGRDDGVRNTNDDDINMNEMVIKRRMIFLILLMI